jgi:hypothetical protein
MWVAQIVVGTDTHSGSLSAGSDIPAFDGRLLGCGPFARQIISVMT